MKEMDKFEMTATTAFGLEEVLAEELYNIGAENIELGNKIVYFLGDNTVLYRANLELRTAIRVLIPQFYFKFRNEKELYENIFDIDWQEILNPNTTLAINSAVKSEKYTNSNFISLKVKDAIVDKLRSHYGKRPNIDLENPYLRLHIFIINDSCTISFDSSGESLHKRGYRTEQGAAPMNETLAAGMILISGWDGQSNFVDPMCGSGTILMEAASIAYNIAPGKNRSHFGFMNFPDYDEALWNKIKEDAISREREFKFKIFGSDADKSAIKNAKANIINANFAWKIIVRNKDFFEYSKEFLIENELLADNENVATIMMNPPYGERISQDDIEVFYEKIGDTLKQNFTGYNAWIISSNKPALKKLGLRTSKKLTLFNAGLECKFHKYELYTGSRKSKYNLTEEN